MKVKNLNGTKDHTCKCGSWIKHWEKFSGYDIPQFCSVKDCLGEDIVGGHVQKDSATDKGWYIIPICSSCNAKRGQDLDIDDSTPLVSANVSKTCGK